MGRVVASGVGGRSRNVAGRWLLLLVALGGLFAMHGLSDHGVGAPAVLRAPTDAVGGHSGATPDDHAAHHGSPQAGAQMGADGGSTEGAYGAAGLPADSGGGHGDHHGSALVGMCLAVLGAALLFGVAAWRARAFVRLRHVLVDDPAVAAATAFLARARGPAPPDLRLLSIQRC